MADQETGEFAGREEDGRARDGGEPGQRRDRVPHSQGCAGDPGEAAIDRRDGSVPGAEALGKAKDAVGEKVEAATSAVTEQLGGGSSESSKSTSSATNYEIREQSAGPRANQPPPGARRSSRAA